VSPPHAIHTVYLAFYSSEKNARIFYFALKEMTLFLLLSMLQYCE